MILLPIQLYQEMFMDTLITIMFTDSQQMLLLIQSQLLSRLHYPKVEFLLLMRGQLMSDCINLQSILEQIAQQYTEPPLSLLVQHGFTHLVQSNGRACHFQIRLQLNNSLGMSCEIL
jgi:hypothetical protein